MDLAKKQKLFQQEYPKLFDYLYRYICYRIQNRVDAEDIVSEVCLQGYSRLKDFDQDQGSLRQWMTGIARNSLLMYWRAKKPAVSLEEYVPLSDDSNSKMVDRIDSQISVKNLVNDLPKETKVLLAMRYIDDMTYDQIAEIVCKEPAAVRQFFSRLHKKLKLKFEEDNYVKKYI